MKKFAVVLSLLCVVAIALLYQQEIINFTFKLLGKNQEPPIKAIAFLNDVNKNVTYKRSFNTAWVIAENNLGLAVLDSVSTATESRTAIKFNVGYLFNLEENSLVVIQEPKQAIANLTELDFHHGTFEAKNEVNNDATLLVKSNQVTTELKGKFDFGMSVDKTTKKAKVWVKTGRAKVSDEKGNELVINENESKDFATDDVIIPVPEVKPEPVPEPKIEPVPAPAPKPVPVKKVTKLRRPTTNEIRRVISGQRQKVDTCYARRRRPGGGRVTFTITLMNTGKLARADLTRSTFQDPTLESCVAFWMKAIKFPKFDGTPIKDNVEIVFK